MKKSQMNKWQKILFLIFIVLFGILLVKDYLINITITTVGSNILGAPLKIQSFSWGLLSQKIRIKNIQVFNPKGFPQEHLIDIPEIGGDYDLASLFKGRLHLPSIIVNMKELVVIKNKEGKLNVDSLKIIEDQKESQSKKKETQSQGKGKMMPFQIDTMKLNVERVLFKDYTKGEMPSIEVYEVPLKDKTIKNISSPKQLVTLILVQALGPTAIQGAKVYLAATILGVGFVPANVVGTLMKKDDVSEEFKSSLEKVYRLSLDLIKQIGDLKSEDKSNGVIKAKVNGSDIAIKIEETIDHKTRVIISARMFMIPKPEVAGGVLYQIKEKLN